MMLVGEALNDYNDRESDKENHPNRPIPAGLISADETLVYSNSIIQDYCSTLDLRISYHFHCINWNNTLISYENKLKALGLSSNIAVGLCPELSFFYAGMVSMIPDYIVDVWVAF